MAITTQQKITNLTECVLCRVCELIDEQIGTLEFEGGGMATAAYRLPDPTYQYSFPPSGTKVNGNFVAVQLIDIVPSNELGSSQVFVKVGICVGNYETPDDLPAIANTLKLAMPEILKVKYYNGDESAVTPNKLILVGVYRI